jgi:hypothetical protein
MASKVKVSTSDIKSLKAKTLLINVVKHAFSTMINQKEYADFINDPKNEMSELMKNK